MNSNIILKNSSEILSFFNTIISLSKEIKSYNFQQFFIRKAEYDKKHLPPQKLSFYTDRIEQMKRIVQVQNLYSDRIKLDKLKYSDPNL